MTPKQADKERKQAIAFNKRTAVTPSMDAETGVVLVHNRTERGDLFWLFYGGEWAANLYLTKDGKWVARSGDYLKKHDTFQQAVNASIARFVVDSEYADNATVSKEQETGEIPYMNENAQKWKEVE